MTKSLRQAIYFFLLLCIANTLLLVSSCGRTKDSNEIVFNDYAFEKDGIYYNTNCSTHSNYKKYSGTDSGYHNNGKIWGTSTVINGLPNGHWEQFDSNGLKKLDLYFDNGKLVKKEFMNADQKRIIELPINKNLSSETTKLVLDTNYVILKFNAATHSIFNNCEATELSLEEIKMLDKIFSNCLSKNRNYLYEKSKYKRQYIPILNNQGQKEVWVNCFCGDNYPDWKTKVIQVNDGGKCYFELKVNLTTKKYYDFYVNGEA